jgi:hypothetical protein
MLCATELWFFAALPRPRGQSAADMERNVAHVVGSAELRDGAQQPAFRAVELARTLVASCPLAERTPRGGRKAYRLEIERT